MEAFRSGARPATVTPATSTHAPRDKENHPPDYLARRESNGALIEDL
jgi:hypothetical protein